MAIFAIRGMEETILNLEDAEGGLFEQNHILEPEYHQDVYVLPCVETAQLPGSFQVGDPELLLTPPFRGRQPFYADDESDPLSLKFEGMVTETGERLDDNDGKQNVCALKSACVRFGYIDTSLARSVPRDFYLQREETAGVKKNDVLVNSTGDGTIGRVAVYNYDFPAVADGHITILRYKDPIIAWYVAAYLLSDDGQKQLYRYINGSSGQVEIYPQDIARIWVRPEVPEKMKEIQLAYQAAIQKYDAFYQGLRSALSHMQTPLFDILERDAPDSAESEDLILSKIQAIHKQ